MIPEAYLKMKYPTPEIFKNKFVGKSALVIATGLSTKKLVQYKHKLLDRFDVIIGLNRSTDDFEEQMTHHLLIEKKPIVIYTDMKKNPSKYRKDLPRILNFKGLHRFPQDLNIVKAARTSFDGNPNIREYNTNNCEGFLNGPLNRQGLSIGSVSLQSIHLVGIMGCSKLYMIGLDLVFGDKFDHYYSDRSYRDNASLLNKSPIVSVTNNGIKYETTEYFRDSAGYLDKVIKTMCRPAGMEVYSFSDGLLTVPIKLDVDEFFGG